MAGRPGGGPLAIFSLIPEKTEDRMPAKAIGAAMGANSNAGSGIIECKKYF